METQLKNRDEIIDDLQDVLADLIQSGVSDFSQEARNNLETAVTQKGGRFVVAITFHPMHLVCGMTVGDQYVELFKIDVDELKAH